MNKKKVFSTNSGVSPIFLGQIFVRCYIFAYCKKFDTILIFLGINFKTLIFLGFCETSISGSNVLFIELIG